MFDDHAPQGGAPNNLPVGNADDMFSAVDKVEPTPETPNATTTTPQPADIEANSQPSAVGAGVLSPKSQEQPVPAQEKPAVAPPLTPEPIAAQSNDTSVVPPPMAAVQNFPTKGPGTAKILMMVLISVVGLALIAGGIWFAYSSVTNKQNNNKVISDFDNNSDNNDTTDVDLSGDIFATDNINDSDDNLDDNLDNTLATSTEPEKTDDEKIDDALIFGQLIDTDGDGLDDVRETDLGTDPKNWDSDGDDLSDGDEVIIWKTQPLNPDTDDDGFKDGEEIKGGYNPVGPGKLFEPPTN
jgi:hypothetical protein